MMSAREIRVPSRNYLKQTRFVPLQATSCAFRASAFPDELDRHLDVRSHTLVHRAAMRGLLDKRTFRMVRRQWKPQLDRKTHNPPWGVSAHVLLHLHPHAGNLEPLALGHDPDRRCDTRRKGSRYQVRRRKGLSFSHVVRWCISDQIVF